MRHRKDTLKLGRTGSHLRCMFANMLKSLIEHNRIETSLSKAKTLKRYADKMITLSKKNTVHAKRLARSELMIRYNPLTPKEKREVKAGDNSSYNGDRLVLNRLFGELRERYLERNGGYTRIIKTDFQRGDNSSKCYIEYID